MEKHEWSNNKSFWEKHYKNYDFFQNQLDWYKETIKFHINNMNNCQTILDTGAGSGNLSVELSEMGKNITAIDNEPYALDLLSKKAQQKNLTIDIIKADVQEIPFQDSSFDWVTSMFVVPFIEDTEKYLTEVYRILKQNGIFSASIRAPVQNIKNGWNMKQDIVDVLTKKDILPKHQKEWQDFLNTSKENAQNIDSKDITDDKIKKILKDIGFVDIVFDSNVAYDKYAYFLKAKKSSNKNKKIIL